MVKKIDRKLDYLGFLMQLQQQTAVKKQINVINMSRLKLKWFLASQREIMNNPRLRNIVPTTSICEANQEWME